MKYGTAKKIICFFVMGVILVALIIGNIFAYIYKQPITSFLAGTGDNFSADDAELQRVLKEGDELCVEMGNESVVLLRNENNALPLDMTDEKERTVNLFGIGAYDQGFMMKGVGSVLPQFLPQGRLRLRRLLKKAASPITRTSLPCTKILISNAAQKRITPTILQSLPLKK